jgi:proline dehydrogenase
MANTDPEGLALLAAAALRRVARNELVKDYIERDPVLFALLLRAARRYIGGLTRAECLGTIARINDTGHAATVDYMGESTRETALAEQETSEFIQLAEDIRRQRVNSTLSLDLSHIGLVIDPQLALEHMRRIAAAAREADTDVMISMEGSERTDAILEVYRTLCSEFDNVGIRLQARLMRTDADLPAMLALPGKISLVKGSYEESQTVAYPRESVELAARYRAFARQLIASGHPVSIATHDASIHADLHTYIEAEGLRDNPFEFEVLVGLGDPEIEQLRTWGYATRIYVVYGREWYLYVCHRLAEEPTRIYQALADIVDANAYATPDDEQSHGSSLFPHR